MKLRTLFSAVTTATFVASCGGSSGSNVSLALKSVSDASDLRQLKTQVLGAVDQTSDLTIESLKIPIGDVGLSTNDELYGTNESGYIYGCESDTEGACDVELVGDALSNLLTGGSNGGSLTSGATYNSVMISTCPDAASQESNTYVAKIKAKATINGTEYYTKTGSQYLTATEADYGPVDITFSSCRNYTVLSQPIVYDGSAVTVNLYIDLRAIAHVVGSNSTLFAGANDQKNCSLPSTETPSGTAPYICLESPDVGGTIKAGNPTVERYVLDNNASATEAPQLIGFFFDADGQPIGGYNRAYLDDVIAETSMQNSPVGFKKTKILDDKLWFSDYSGGEADTELGSGTTVSNQASTQGDFTVLDFPRPAVGDAADTITAVEDNDGAAVTVDFDVTRID